ncbi:MAG: flagellar biosynthesis anti-sigma factor FlgM [Mariprofundaceae bacterium]|nr:flagellar biosynthesis anti-sigma factor FlgM [Mariprofundaceae bacterium]
MVRISGPNRPSGVSSAKAGGKKRTASSSSASAGASDRVQVADATALREKAKVMIADMPDVRLERIEEIRGALEQGQYEVDNRKVAARIIINALAERLW